MRTNPSSQAKVFISMSLHVVPTWSPYMEGDCDSEEWTEGKGKEGEWKWSHLVT